MKYNELKIRRVTLVPVVHFPRNFIMRSRVGKGACSAMQWVNID